MRTAFSFTCLFLVLSCSTPTTVAPLSVPLQYKTMASPGDFGTLPSCAAISRVQVSDRRSEPEIGKRVIEGQNSPPAPVTASGDVAAWVQAGIENALKRSGVTVGTAGAPVLHVTVEQISSTENVLHRSGYDGRIVLAAELRAGRASCWHGRADGNAENYGYSGSVENYQETLNHALDRAAIQLLGASDFKSAVCSRKCGG